METRRSDATAILPIPSPFPRECIGFGSYWPN